jgi:hypothetical protein
MDKNTSAVIFERLELKVDDLLAEEIPEKIIKNLNRLQSQKLANRISDIMFATYHDAVCQACKEQGILPIIEEE